MNKEKSLQAQLKVRINHYSIERALKYFRKYCREIDYDEFAEIFETRTLYQMVVHHKREEKRVAAEDIAAKAQPDHILCKGVVVKPVTSAIQWNFGVTSDKALTVTVRNRLMPDGAVSPGESIVFEVRGQSPRLGRLSIVPQSNNCFQIIIE